MPLVAGVDSSTTATKLEVRDLDSGQVVGGGSSPHPPTRPPRSEQPPAAWWAAFEAAWQQAGAPDVAAVSVAGQQHGMVALDADRRVIRPAKLWNDTESAPEAASLLERLAGGRRAWAEACGLVPVASFTITKLAWLRRHEPRAWERLAHVALPHDWLTLELTGRLVTDRGDASGTGYWSAASGAYRHDLLALVDAERDWAPVVPTVLGPLEAAGEWNGALVGPGTGDNMAGALGVGLRPRDVVVSIGTSGTVYGVSDEPTADASGIVAGFADATGRHLPLVCTLNATKVTDAAARLLGVDHEGLDRLALAGPPGAGGLTLLPYLDGERTPDRPNATGVVAGLRSDVGREQLARAAVEGVVCGLLDGLDALASFAPTDGQLIVVGGGSRSHAYRQVLADLSGREVLVPHVGEQVATGACVQAAAVAAHSEPADIADAWKLGAGDLVEPGPGVAAAADVRAAYAALRDATGD
ncbi:MAG TPA: xylulokinase [Acidimicrobiales bacterium]|nr:xylulokinase [Acidimicrobiales bacterium]